jgi:hypothetical protein
MDFVTSFEWENALIVTVKFYYQFIIYAKFFALIFLINFAN